MTNNQYGSPIIISQEGNQSQALTRIDLIHDVSFTYNEDWLQDTIHSSPTLLPVNDIDPIFGTLIPVCRELMTPVGPLDNLFINELGMLTLVECKLWRNPEARRKVVGQILDYAQEFSRMAYDDLVNRINHKTGMTGNSLYEIVADKTEDLVEKDFVDSVIMNLQRGRFLLLIVGDGIREDVENISGYLQNHAQLNFTFALVAEELYRIGDEEKPSILVQPRIIAKTVEIERAVIRIEGNTSNVTAEAVSVMASEENSGKYKPSPRRKSITEQVFYEEIEKQFSGYGTKIKVLFDELIEKGLALDAGSAAIHIKDRNKQFNFLSFQKDGTVRNYGLGNKPLGLEYMEKLNELTSHTVIHKVANGFHTTIKNADGTYLNIKDVLAVKETWFELIDWVVLQLDA